MAASDCTRPVEHETVPVRAPARPYTQTVYDDAVIQQSKDVIATSRRLLDETKAGLAEAAWLQEQGAL